MSTDLQSLMPRAEAIAVRLRATRTTLAVSESSAGGLISAALLAVPGASAYFMGGAVIYTRAARTALLGVTEADMAGLRSSSEPYAQLMARTVRTSLGTDWGLSETGAAGPAGNSYGDAAGHACFAVAGAREAVVTLETGSGDRLANMLAFAQAALDLLDAQLRG